MDRRKKAGRKPRISLMAEVQRCMSTLDLDRLSESYLINLPAIQRRIQPHRTMAAPRALREALLQAMSLTIRDIEHIPSLSNVKIFLERRLRGDSVSQIARDLNLSREWVSRHYRSRAYRLAAEMFVILVSFDESGIEHKDQS
jgi:hypothetical protein